MIFQPLISWFTLVLFALVGLGLVIITAWRGTGEPRRVRLLTAVRRGAMVLVLAVAFAGPALPVEQEEVVSNVEIVFAVDRTGSMAAEDGPGGTTRLDAARRDIRVLVESAPSARFAVITWDSSSRVELPVTTDSSAVARFADNLHQEVSEFSTGSTLDRPAQTVLDLLQNSAEQRPQNLRYLVVISDGESTQQGGEAETENPWAEVAQLIDGGAVLGYGTEEGGPMRVFGVGGIGITEEYMLNEDGERAISVLDQDSLQRLASTLGVAFLLNPDQPVLNQLGNDFIEGAQSVIEGRSSVVTYWYLTWVPALVLAALVGWETAVFTARLMRLRRTNALW
ncbi:vWA domain-containing protein [Actinomyces minihominis]|uniref:vWA domain-containing protein n=1 Tax=Actinomyces minihominis TaxID=2002838 RepID=UPI000C08C370|nr:VWA domain-containing protein [Actinomyces minihominis]